MPSVSSLKKRYENIAQQEHSEARQQRVQVTRYSMPFRQSTLNFGTLPKRQSMPVAPLRMAAHALTPPAEESEGDTIIVNPSACEPQRHAPLPTPSESATDVSSQSSNTPKATSRIRSRSKRVSNPRNNASKDTRATSIAASSTSSEKQRNISGETLVPESVNTSQTTLLKDSIGALDMAWNMSVQFDKQKDIDEQTEGSSTITVAAVEPGLEPEPESEEARQKREAKRLKMAENAKKWEQRRKAAEKHATRRSSRASMLVTKATEVVAAVTSTVLGKRGRDSYQKDDAKDTSPVDGTRPESKKARLQDPTSAHGDEVSLSNTNKAMRSRAPRDKKWLTSGLYAGQSRALAETKNKRKSTSTDIDSQLPNQPTKENTFLPLPMFAGARLLDTGRDFKLPFDVFSPLAAGHPKPDEWRKVNKNVFVGDAADQWRTSKFLEHSTCMCSPATGCDADCMNRYMYYECDDRNCNLTAENCGNRAFEGLRQRVKKGGKYNIGVEVLRTADRGYGVRANRTFEPHQIIVEYTGEIINQEECEDRMHSIYKDNECYYLMAFDQNMIIDATRGSMARFVNHSCDPNCRMEKWTVSGKPRMALFAGDRGIMTGEELTYDYNFDPYSQKNVQVCRCGSDNCRGVLGPKPKDAVIKEMQKEKETKLAGAKRKLGEILEESTNLLNKKRKVDEKPKLPKGWAYVEPEPKAKPQKKEANVSASEEGSLSRQPSKLKRALSEKSNRNTKANAVGGTKKRAADRVVSTSSEKALIDGDADGVDGERPSTASSAVASLKAKAETLKRSVGKSLRGGR